MIISRFFQFPARFGSQNSSIFPELQANHSFPFPASQKVLKDPLYLLSMTVSSGKVFPDRFVMQFEELSFVQGNILSSAFFSKAAVIIHHTGMTDDFASPFTGFKAFSGIFPGSFFVSQVGKPLRCFAAIKVQHAVHGFLLAQ